MLSRIPAGPQRQFEAPEQVTLADILSSSNRSGDRAASASVAMVVAERVQDLAPWLAGECRAAGIDRAKEVALAFGPGAGTDFEELVVQTARGRGEPAILGGRLSGSRGVAGAIAGLHRQTVDIDAVAPRLRTVRLPAALASAGAVVGAVDVRPLPGPRPPIVIGMWARFAGPMQRLGARITPQREGILAEIDFAIRPALLIVLDRRLDDTLVAIAGADPVAVELVTLALRRVQRDSRLDQPGPWEDPLVQRATELGLGIDQPSQLLVELRTTGDIVPDRMAFERALAGIGVPPEQFFLIDKA
jgi:hypothetical protein